jgi:hypothetical protein
MDGNRGFEFVQESAAAFPNLWRIGSMDNTMANFGNS